MSIFLTENERARLKSLPLSSPNAALFSAMQSRVSLRSGAPGLSDRTTTTEWWHHAAEYLTDAALVHAVRPTPEVAVWLRSTVLGIARRPPCDWGGPPFRGYRGGADAVGTLETGHLTWSLAVALDLAPELFSSTEYEEISTALCINGLEACRRYLTNTGFCHNWNLVLLAGTAVAAAVLGDDDALAEAIAWFPLAADHFQPDGSYGESLQYANYAAYSLILAREAILRRSPETTLTLEPYARFVNWAAQSHFYRKPLSGWGTFERSRSANFGDSAAIFRPSGDLLAHIAVHAKETLPTEAGLARWLFDALYFPASEPPPHDLASFGFVPGFGFLSVILFGDTAAPISPVEAQLLETSAFSAGDVFARDSWNGLTTLAARTASEPRHATAHIHGDINSFILVHRKERLLLDPGHSCYRNINHDLEAASLTHNTCTFEIGGRHLTQRGGINRPIVRDKGSMHGAPPIDLGGRRLISARIGNVSVIGSEAAPLYGEPLRTFTRLWVLCGANALFIVDRFESDEPVRTTWHWLLNNRDGLLDLAIERPNTIIARRGEAGLKLVHCGDGQMSGPVYANVHDAYHPLPAQLGEGKPGTGMLMRWTEAAPATARTLVHAIALDDTAVVGCWNVISNESSVTIESPDQRQKWQLRFGSDCGSYDLTEELTDIIHKISRNTAGNWDFI
ncbi:MAG: heparinase II/III family protein [Luteolibacter sp.]